MPSLNNVTPDTCLSDFKAFSEKYVPVIESALEQALSVTVSDERQSLCNALEHSLLDSGKRLRPLLAIASHQLFSSDVDSILPLACALEMIHTYSLIHDDLPCMDDDDFRRGKPTCHVRFGEDIAVLAGDTLNTLAFEILSSQLGSFEPRAVLDTVCLISQASGINGLVGGQVLDIKSHSSFQDLDKLMFLHQKKTGSLFMASIVSAGILNEASDDVLDLLRDFSAHVGLLFQIVDDILDVVGTKEALGKSPGKDQALDKLTYMSILSLDQARDKAQEEANLASHVLDRLSQDHGLSTTVLRTIVDFMLIRSY